MDARSVDPRTGWVEMTKSAPATSPRRHPERRPGESAGPAGRRAHRQPDQPRGRRFVRGSQLAMPLTSPVGKVQTCDVHPRLDQRLHLSQSRRCGTERAHDLGSTVQNAPGLGLVGRRHLPTMGDSGRVAHDPPTAEKAERSLGTRRPTEALPGRWPPAPSHRPWRCARCDAQRIAPAVDSEIGGRKGRR